MVKLLTTPLMNLARGNLWSGSSGVAPNSDEAQQYFDRLFTPLTPGGALEGHYATFIDGLVADGVWVLMDQITLFFAGNTEGDTLINLKNGTWNASRASASGHAVWTLNEYYDQGAVNRAITSNFNPSTAVGANFSRNDFGIGVWIADATQYDSTACDAGTWTPGSGFNNPWDLAIIPKWVSGYTYWEPGSASETMSTGVTDSSGFFWMQRTGANAAALYYNNTLHASTAGASVALPNSEMYCTVKHRTRAWMFGASLTAPQRTALYDRLSTFVTAITGGMP